MSFTPVQKSIILLGDSITQFSTSSSGLHSSLLQLFARKLDVLNRGLAGYSSEMVLPLAREILHPSNDDGKGKDAVGVALLVLWLGANDAVLFDGPIRKAVSVEAYKANLRAILEQVPKQVPRLLFTPPIPQPNRWAAHRQLEVPDRAEAHTALYAEACRSLVADLKVEGVSVELVDVWKAMDAFRSQPDKRLDALLVDGLHLSETGYRLVNTLVLPALRRLGLDPEEMQETYPDWAQAPTE